MTEEGGGGSWPGAAGIIGSKFGSLASGLAWLSSAARREDSRSPGMSLGEAQTMLLAPGCLEIGVVTVVGGGD